MVLSTSQARAAYGPHCAERPHPGAQEAWDAHQAVMRFYGYLLRAGDTGSRNCRPITGGTDYSLHAFFLACVIHLWNLGKSIAAALALDSNWNSNPYGPKLITDRPRAMCDDIEAIRTGSGAQVFRWGGHYAGNKDAMHDEIVCAPADLATGIDQSTVRGHASHPDTPTVQEDDDMRIVNVTDGPHAHQAWLIWPDRHSRHIDNPAELSELEAIYGQGHNVSGGTFAILTDG